MLSELISDSTVKAAVITAVLAFSGSIFVAFFSRSQKVAEFRQAWIDNLREDIASFITLISQANHLMDWCMKHNGGNATDELDEVLILLSKKYNLIILRLNKIDDLGLILIMDKLISSYQPEIFNYGYNKSKRIEILEISHDILKTEWDRVKSGEIIYVIKKAKREKTLLRKIISIIKFISMAIFMGVLIAIIITFLSIYFPPFCQIIG